MHPEQAERLLREITDKHNPEYAPITAGVFIPQADGTLRNSMLRILPVGKEKFVFVAEAAEFLGMSWKDTWSFIKAAEMTAALEDRAGQNPLICREVLQTLRGERLPQPGIVRRYWQRQADQARGVKRV